MPQLTGVSGTVTMELDREPYREREWEESLSSAWSLVTTAEDDGTGLTKL
jgi:hypothetical protein